MITADQIKFEGPSPVSHPVLGKQIAMRATIRLCTVVFASAGLEGLPETEGHLKKMAIESLLEKIRDCLEGDAGRDSV